MEDQEQRRRVLQNSVGFNCENGRRSVLKSNKPLLEKKRRARINKSLEQLKSLLMETIRNDTSAGYSKLEKADILELAVKHLRHIQQRQQQTAASDPSVLMRYCSGFKECAEEVNRYLTAVDGLDSEFRLRLISHLADCISPPQPPSADQYPRDLRALSRLHGLPATLTSSTPRHRMSPYSMMTSSHRQSVLPVVTSFGTSSPGVEVTSTCDPAWHQRSLNSSDCKFDEDATSQGMWCPMTSLVAAPGGGVYSQENMLGYFSPPVLPTTTSRPPPPPPGARGQGHRALATLNGSVSSSSRGHERGGKSVLSDVTHCQNVNRPAHCPTKDELILEDLVNMKEEPMWRPW